MPDVQRIEIHLTRTADGEYRVDVYRVTPDGLVWDSAREVPVATWDFLLSIGDEDVTDA